MQQSLSNMRFFALVLSIIFLAFACKDDSDSDVVLPSGSKEITSFKFQASSNSVLSSNILGDIDEDTKTIYCTVPIGTNVTALVAFFEHSGAQLPSYYEVVWIIRVK